VVGVVAAIIPILVGYFLVTGMATSNSYTLPGGATSTTSTVTSTGPGTSVSVSIPSGAGNPNGAPGYAPATVKVVIGTNNTVVWVNNDNAHHTVTSKPGNGSINSGDMAAGAKYNFTFTSPGTYTYICEYHTWMVGTVVVVAGAAATTISIPNGAGNPSGAPGFLPANFTVILGVNNTVTWTNNDSSHHTVTATDHSFDSGDMAAGAKFTYVFKTAGTFNYICNYHSWMKGTVTVVKGK
jgi:plastocyanin